jgi:hypothetical protein
MLEALSNDERDIVRRAMIAAADGEFFPEWEFHTLFGVTRIELRDAIARFPALDGEADFCSVNNSLLWLVAYPHKRDDDLNARNLDAETLVALHKKFLSGMGKPADSFLDFMA